MDNTGRLVGAACAGALLLACGAPRQHVGNGAPQVAVQEATPFLGADAYYALGRSEHEAHRPAAARRAYGLALQVDPAHADARNGIAVLLAEQGDYAPAIALWRALVTEAEGAALPAAERAFLLGNLGYALYLQGERDEALAMLEQACVLDPYQPLAWEHLASVLEATSDTARALQMMKQARMLRTHDIRQDYALAGTALPAVAAPAPRESPWPAGLARTEVQRVGAVVEVRRVAARALPPALPTKTPAVAAAPAPAGNVQSTFRLEISNGNGVRGMAAAWARRLRQPAFAQWQSVRLTNVRPFAVAVSRIEYRDSGAAGDTARVLATSLATRLGMRAMPADGPAAGLVDLRIVLGWDQRADVAQARKRSAQGSRQAP